MCSGRASVVSFHGQCHNRIMMDMDLGGIPAGTCQRNEVLALKGSSEHMTIVKRHITPDTQPLYSLMFRKHVEVLSLPLDDDVIAAFDAVMSACKTFGDTAPPYMSESLDQALETIERGEPPQCCQPIDFAPTQLELMAEVRAKYEKFLAAMERH